jgi:hypothetical protein
MGITHHSWIESISSYFHVYGNEKTTKLENLLAKARVHFPLPYYIQEFHT